MSTISSASRPPHKRPHIASPTPNNQIDDHSSKRQKTVRTYTSTSTTSTTTSPITNINGRHHHPPSFSSSSIVSSEFSSQPDTRGPALPADFFDTSATSSSSIPTILPIGGQNRNAPASHVHAQVPIQHPPPAASETTATAEIDEDEWAAFQADIAETEDTLNNPTPSVSILPSSAVITAAPTGPGGNLSTEEDEETRIDEAALDREDAQNKLVEEFEEMESLESRVQKLKEQREALRAKATESVGGRMDVTTNGVPEQEDDDEDDDEEDDWIHFSR